MRATYLPVMRELFERICEAAAARGLDWKARKDGDTIGFKSPLDPTFKIAIHCFPKSKRVYEPPSLLIHPPRPLADLGVANPYPDLQTFWTEPWGAQGWSVPIVRDIPDVGPAVDLAVRLGRP
jgi:hypothetical protein